MNADNRRCSEGGQRSPANTHTWALVTHTAANISIIEPVNDAMVSQE